MVRSFVLDWAAVAMRCAAITANSAGVGGYEDLTIKEGSLASIAFAEIQAPATPPERVVELRTALRAYCKRDTEAMVELYRLLRT